MKYSRAPIRNRGDSRAGSPCHVEWKRDSRSSAYSKKSNTTAPDHSNMKDTPPRLPHFQQKSDLPSESIHPCCHPDIAVAQISPQTSVFSAKGRGFHHRKGVRGRALMCGGMGVWECGSIGLSFSFSCSFFQSHTINEKPITGYAAGVKSPSKSKSKKR